MLVLYFLHPLVVIPKQALFSDRTSVPNVGPNLRYLWQLRSYATAIGITLGKVRVTTPSRQLTDSIQLGPILFILDSIKVGPCESQRRTVQGMMDVLCCPNSYMSHLKSRFIGRTHSRPFSHATYSLEVCGPFNKFDRVIAISMWWWKTRSWLVSVAEYKECVTQRRRYRKATAE